MTTNGLRSDGGVLSISHRIASANRQLALSPPFITIRQHGLSPALSTHNNTRNGKSRSTRINVGSLVHQFTRRPRVIEHNCRRPSDPDGDDGIVILLTPFFEYVPRFFLWKLENIAENGPGERSRWHSLSKEENSAIIDDESDGRDDDEGDQNRRPRHVPQDLEFGQILGKCCGHTCERWRQQRISSIIYEQPRPSNCHCRPEEAGRRSPDAPESTKLIASGRPDVPATPYRPRGNFRSPQKSENPNPIYNVFRGAS